MTARVDGQRTRRRRVAAAWIVIATALAGCSWDDEGDAFVAYTPSAELVPLLGEPTDLHLGGWVPDVHAECPVDELKDIGAQVGPRSSGWKVLIQHIGYDEDEALRDVAFATMSFRDREAFEQQWTTLQKWFALPCISADYRGDTDVEPLSLSGLPARALSASWPSPSFYDQPIVGQSAVVADPESLIMMFVVWTEGPQPLSTDDFVEVVNTAWAEFEANNS